MHEWTDEALTVCIFLRVDKRELTDAFAFWFPRCRRPLKVAPLLRYGKYCGILYSGCLGEKPCDALDACCMVHDHCVDANDGIISQLPASFSQKRKDGTGEKQGEKELFFCFTLTSPPNGQMGPKVPPNGSYLKPLGLVCMIKSITCVGCRACPCSA